MPAKLAILRSGNQDLNKGFHWYEGQRAGLGKRFRAAVNACTTGIARSLKAGRIVQDPYRRAVVRGFPYIVIYYYDEPNDTVIVHGVFHTSQDPAIWQQRLP